MTRVYLIVGYSRYILSAHRTQELAHAAAKRWRKQLGRFKVSVLEMEVDAPDDTEPAIDVENGRRAWFFEDGMEYEDDMMWEAAIEDEDDMVWEAALEEDDDDICNADDGIIDDEDDADSTESEDAT